MKKPYIITTASIILIVVTQLVYISNIYNDYIENITSSIEDNISKAIDIELKGRMFGDTDDHLSNTDTQDLNKAKSKSAHDARSMPIASISDIFNQVAQDMVYDGGVSLNVASLDSLFTPFNKDNISTNFVLTDNITGEVKQSKLQDTTEYRYRSKIFPIGVTDKQVVQLYYNIPLPSFIKASIWSLIVSLVTLILMVMTSITMLRELQQKHKALENLQDNINGTIHDLRSPLNSAIMTLDVIISSQLSEQLKSFAKNSRISLISFSENIRTMLSIARGDIREEQVSEEQINNSCKVLISDLGILYGSGSKISLKTNLPSNFTMQGDYLLLENIIRNLLDNSVKYGKNSEVLLSISVEDSKLKVTVEDGGDGIASSDQRKIFKRFYQLDKNCRDGYGMGLYNSHRIVKMLGGDMGVKSIVNRGSKFWFTIPCKIDYK